MTTTLVFNVPVYVTVDDVKPTILNVAVDDQAVPPDPTHAEDSGGNVLDAHIDRERIERAIGLAHERTWPEWEVGV